MPTCDRQQLAAHINKLRNIAVAAKDVHICHTSRCVCGHWNTNSIHAARDDTTTLGLGPCGGLFGCHVHVEPRAATKSSPATRDQMRDMEYFSSTENPGSPSKSKSMARAVLGRGAWRQSHESTTCPRCARQSPGRLRWGCRAGCGGWAHTPATSAKPQTGKNKEALRDEQGTAALKTHQRKNSWSGSARDHAAMAARAVAILEHRRCQRRGARQLWKPVVDHEHVSGRVTA